MRKHLVVTVHGIGEQLPGHTVDALVGAARHELDLQGQVTTSNVMLADDAETRDGQLDLYPCHIRRMAQDDQTELVFAEAHWADLSRAPRGTLATLFDLMRLVLGLGYLALENVQNNDLPRFAWVRVLVPLFVWVFYALIAPLNAFLLVCAIFLLGDPFLFDLDKAAWRAPGFLVAVGLLQAGVGAGLARMGHSYLATVFCKSLSLIGVGTALYGVAFMAAPDFVITVSFGLPQCSSIPDAGLPALNCYLASVVLGLQTIWVAAVAMLLLLVLFSWRGTGRDFGNKRSIYLSICAGMMLLWMAFSVGIWSVFRQAAKMTAITERNEDDPLVVQLLNAHFDDLTQTLVYAVAAIGVQVCVALLVLLWRGQHKDGLGQTPHTPTPADRWLGRVILNPAQNLSLFAAIPILVFGVFYAVAEFVLLEEPPNKTYEEFALHCYDFTHRALGIACEIDNAVSAYAAVAVSLIALLGLLIINFSDAVAAGVGVARDVIVYVTRSERANPTRPDNTSRYVFRDRIERRFSNTIRQLLEAEGADQVARMTILSHSQGTVVARRGLDALAPDTLPPTVLVTMGSPLTHIYGQYFRADYTFDPATAPFVAWHNIYRADDFVGTWVKDYGTTAENHRVRPRGHTKYWTDQHVWDVLRKLEVFVSLRR